MRAFIPHLGMRQLCRYDEYVGFFAAGGQRLLCEGFKHVLCLNLAVYVLDFLFYADFDIAGRVDKGTQRPTGMLQKNGQT